MEQTIQKPPLPIKEKGDLANLSVRIAAQIYDGILVNSPIWMIFCLLSFFINRVKNIEVTYYYIGYVTSFIFLIYAGILVGEYGWTVGKRYNNIKIVTAGTFKKIGFSKAFLRSIMKYGLPLFFALLSLIIGNKNIIYIAYGVLFLNLYLIAATPKRQAVHDMIANTQVIITSPLDGRKKKMLMVLIIVLLILFLFSYFYSHFSYGRF